MRRTGITRWSFAAAAAVSLAFGTAQAFATPGSQRAGAFCNPIECRNYGCGIGCGGECVNNECYCDC